MRTTSIIILSLVSISILSCSQREYAFDPVMRSGEYCTADDLRRSYVFLRDSDTFKRQCLTLSPSERVSCYRSCMHDSRSYHESITPPDRSARDCSKNLIYTDRLKWKSADDCVDYYVGYCVESCIYIKSH